MTNLFVDTSGWGHLVDPKQAHHLLAQTLYRRAKEQGRQGSVLTTSYIIAELVTLLTNPLRTPRP